MNRIHFTKPKPPPKNLQRGTFEELLARNPELQRRISEAKAPVEMPIADSFDPKARRWNPDQERSLRYQRVQELPEMDLRNTSSFVICDEGVIATERDVLQEIAPGTPRRVRRHRKYE